MKKIVTSLVLAGLLLGAFVLPMVVSAQNIPQSCTISRPEVAVIHPTPNVNCPNVGSPANLEGAEAVCCVFNAVYTVTMWIFWFILALVILFVIIGAFQILTSGGNPEKVASGRKFLIYAAVGLILALAARAIPGLSRTVMGL